MFQIFHFSYVTMSFWPNKHLPNKVIEVSLCIQFIISETYLYGMQSPVWFNKPRKKSIVGITTDKLIGAWLKREIGDCHKQMFHIPLFLICLELFILYIIVRKFMKKWLLFVSKCPSFRENQCYFSKQKKIQ